MAIKKVKSFSPYSYGIRYRKVGESPFRKYEYISTGGATEPVYVITKKEANYFCSITNFWYFNISDYGDISFLKVDSTISINNKRKKSYLKASNINDSFNSLKFIINSLNGDSYSWSDNKTVNVFHNFNVEIDSIIMINNEYVDEKCLKYYHNGYLEINFLNINLKSSDEIIIVVYPISSNLSFVNSEFFCEKIEKNNLIDDQVNEKYLIENSFGSINKKVLIKCKDDKILNCSSFDVLPSYILINKSDIELISEVDSILTYSSLGLMKTVNIQYGINTNEIIWSGNICKIYHGFGSDVNFIIDRNDSRKMIKTIKNISNNYLEINFNDPLYDPTVFSITIFKVGE